MGVMNRSAKLTFFLFGGTTLSFSVLHFLLTVLNENYWFLLLWLLQIVSSSKQELYTVI